MGKDARKGRRTRIGRLTADRDQLRERLQAVEAERDEAREEGDRLRERVKSVETERDAASAERDRLREAHGLIEKELSVANADRNRLGAELRGARDAPTAGTHEFYPGWCPGCSQNVTFRRYRGNPDRGDPPYAVCQSCGSSDASRKSPRTTDVLNYLYAESGPRSTVHGATIDEEVEDAKKLPARERCGASAPGDGRFKCQRLMGHSGVHQSDAYGRWR